MKRTGSYLAIARQKAGLSQWEVAKSLKLKSGQLVSNWERGLCDPPIRKLAAVSKLYGVPVRVLFNRLMREVKRRDWEVVKGE